MLKRLLLLPVLLCGLFLSACNSPETGGGAVDGDRLTAAAKPNIIYILADDLGYGDLGSYGQAKIKTPVLDRMAANGLRFTDHYSGSTVCAPSRCVLMTGKHTGVCYTRGNNRGADGYGIAMPGDEPSVARLMQEAGYATACIGKWGLGGPTGHSSPNGFGFDFFYGFLDQRHAHNHYPDYLWRNNEKEETGNIMTQASRAGPFGSGVAVKRVAYAGDLFFKESSGWIARQAKADKPFFLYLALTVPHANNEANRLVEHMPKEAQDQRGQEVPDFGPYADKDWSGPNKGQAAMITRMDRQIGEIVQQLEALGIADNTLIMFTSDNGPHAEGGNSPDFFDANGPYRGIKRDLYDGGIRVPMIAYWPGTIAPGTTDHISGFQDVLPTCADLAGVDIPRGITGISFKPTLIGANDQAQHIALYWEFMEQQGKQAVRMGQWKGIRLRVHKDQNGPIQLYDINADPGEKNDIAAKHPEVVQKIAQVMRIARQRSEVPGFRFQWER